MRWRPSSRQLSPQAPWLPERRDPRCVLVPAELFCCSRCRRRTTSMSVRFLGRACIWAWWCCCSARHAGQNTAAATVCEGTAVPLRTLQRWRRWWREDFNTDAAVGRRCAHFMPRCRPRGCRVICSHALPAAGSRRCTVCCVWRRSRCARSRCPRALSSRRGCRSPPTPRLRSSALPVAHHPSAPDQSPLEHTDRSPQRDRWARLRFSIIGSCWPHRPAGRVNGALRHARRPHLAPPISGRDVRWACRRSSAGTTPRRAADLIAVLRDRPRQGRLRA